ncbi:MAG: DoxX family protein [Saprospiraceae bacterium]|nr:DoxX family protein [Saprospiraceae bacterium]
MNHLKSVREYLDARQGIGLLCLRLFIGGRLLYGVVDNVFSWPRMIEFSLFLEANGFPLPLVSALVSVYAQLFGAICILVGFKIRVAALALTVNFVVALVFYHLPAGDSIEGMTPALAMLFGCVTLFFTGADVLSLEHMLRDRRTHA